MRNSQPLKPAMFASLCVAIATISTPFTCRAQSAGDGLKFPYQALVLHDDATIHSGPGEAHYATQNLAQGDAVEVHRHDPGGWCAIRPTNKSFSLIPEATLEIVKEGVGRITNDGTQAWVGTGLGPVENPLWQVKLKKGELVEVKGQVSWPDPDGHSTIWYQVSPPAGEFRWVRMSDIQLPASARLQLASSQKTSGPNLNSPPQTNSSIQNVRSLNEIVEQTPALVPPGTLTTNSQAGSAVSGKQTNPVQQASLQTEFEAVSPSAIASINEGWRKATRPIGKAGSPNDTKSAFDDNSSIYSGGPNFDATTNTATSGGFYSNQGNLAPSLRVANADLASPNLALELNAVRNGLQNSVIKGDQNFSQQMSELEIQLTAEMLKEPTQWRLEELEVAAEKIHQNTSDATERAIVEKFLNKVTSCKAIHSGYQSGGAVPGSGSGLESTQLIGTGIKQDVALGTTYDAHGWLNQMVRDGGQGEPAYVLQDETGKITHHVSPAPGMNLTRYLKNRVGIFGQRGYHSQLKLDHVTAHRIVELEKKR